MPKIENCDAYPGQDQVMIVHYRLDVVPGAYHQPSDLPFELTHHRYVVSVQYGITDKIHNLIYRLRQGIPEGLSGDGTYGPALSETEDLLSEAADTLALLMTEA